MSAKEQVAKEAMGCVGCIKFIIIACTSFVLFAYVVSMFSEPQPKSPFEACVLNECGDSKKVPALYEVCKEKCREKISK